MLPLMAAVAVHVLAGVFWAGVTFVQAGTGGALGQRFMPAQIGAAIFTVGSGGYLWSTLHRGQFGPFEQTLAIGVAAALLAIVVQAVAGATVAFARRRGTLGEEAAQHRMALAQRVGSGLLAVSIVCMATARYV